MVDVVRMTNKGSSLRVTFDLSEAQQERLIHAAVIVVPRENPRIRMSKRERREYVEHGIRLAVERVAKDKE